MYSIIAATHVWDILMSELYLYRVDMRALEGPSQFWVSVRATDLLPVAASGSGRLFSSCTKLRRSPRDLKAAGVTTRFSRSLD